MINCQGKVISYDQFFRGGFMKIEGKIGNLIDMFLKIHCVCSVPVSNFGKSLLV